MKTIKQIADELGVSKTAVRKKFTDEIRNQFAETNGNTVFISEKGEKLIKLAFDKKNKTQVCETKSETVSNLVSDLVSTLQKELEVKNSQIAEQSKTIENQSKTIENLSSALNSSQALHAGTIQQQLQKSDCDESIVSNLYEQKEQSFFKKFFKNKK